MKKTGLPKFTEKRFICWKLIEEMIETSQWYNNGTDEEMNELKAFVEERSDVTTEDLVIIANDILEHTKFPCDKKLICFIDYVEEKCCRTFYFEAL